MAAKTTMPDQELGDLALTGDQDAWTTLVERHHRRLIGLAISRGVDAADAEDVVQYAWTQLAVHLHHIGTERIRQYLGVTVNHRAIDLRRRQQRVWQHFGSKSALLEANDQPDEAAPDIGHDMDREAIQEAVAVLLRLLPHHDRTALWMMASGHTGDQCAAVLPFTRSAVKSRIHRARLLLRRHLQDRGIVSMDDLLTRTVRSWA